MTNRGFTKAEMLHHTIITNRASAEATCPDCDGATRTKAIDGQLHRICRAACGWKGEYLAAQTEAARAALVARGEGHLISAEPLESAVFDDDVDSLLPVPEELVQDVAQMLRVPICAPSAPEETGRGLRFCECGYTLRLGRGGVWRCSKCGKWTPEGTTPRSMKDVRR